MSGSGSKQAGLNSNISSGNSISSGGSDFLQNVFNSGALQNLYNAAQSAYGNANAQTQQQLPGAMQNNNIAAQQAMGANNQNLQGGVYGNLGIGNSLMQSLNSTLNNPSNSQKLYQQITGGEGNSYLPALKASMEKDQNNINNMNQAQIDAQAAAAGQSGGARQGVAQALNTQLGNQALARNENQMGYDTFNQDLQNKLGIAGMADQNTLARQQLMSGMLGQQQGTINQGIGNTSNIQGYNMGGMNAANAGMNPLQQYIAAIGGPAILNSGSSRNNTNSSANSLGFGQSSGSSKSGGV
jgi:hypothetical protein